MTSSPRISPARLALAVRKLRAERDDLALLASDPIAVIGMACRFPGKSHSPEEYWAALTESRDGIVEMPESRWRNRAQLEPAQRLGGYLDSIDGFDAEFFGIAPREANQIDPQQRLLLEVVWEALWDAGIAPESLTGANAGIFAAIYNNDYARMHFSERAAPGEYAGIGTAHSVAAGRLSYLLNIRGPSVAVDTACSSSLVATHLAVQSLRSGECSLAIVGASSLKVLPDEVVVFSRWGMLAKDGKCKTFDASADGFAAGEGSGVVILKRLSEALQEGDRVRAVVRGTAVNHDGRTSVLTAPSGLAQQAVIRTALGNARIEPEEVGYIETHGTGTSLGDPIEVEALQAVCGLGESAADQLPCVLGAVKTNLGHLEAAAGLAGLIKAVLCLENEAIPGNLHFHALNPQISLKGSRFVIPTDPVAWPRSARARVAGVSSFGLGGTNAHVIVEEAPVVPAGRARAPLARRAWKRERCWLPEPPVAGNGVTGLPPREPVLYPLLGRPIRSGFVQGSLFEAEIGTDTVAYLRDHSLGDRPLLPFAGFLEMAHAAGRQDRGDASFAIADFAVGEALFVGSEAGAVQTLVSGKQIEIASERRGLWTKHARGSLREAANTAPATNLSAARARCSEAMDPAEVYRRLESSGLRYGPAFRGMAAVWRGAGESVALIRLPENLRREAAAYGLHPALLDGCLQAVVAALPEISGDLLLPVAAEEFHLLRAGATEVWAQVVLRTPGPDRITADISIADAAGAGIAVVRGFQAKRVTLASVTSEAQKEAQVYQIVWRAEPLRAAAEIPQDSRRWLLVESVPGDAAGLATRLASGRAETTVVPLVDAAPRVREGAWTDVLLHLSPGETIRNGVWEHPERSAVEFVLTFARSLSAKLEVPRLWVVAAGTAAVIAGEDISLSRAPLAGLLRTLACEHPRTAPVMIDCDAAGGASVDAITCEILGRGPDPMVAMRRGTRYAARLVSAPPVADRVERLASDSPGVLDTLRWEPADRPAPGSDEIEIEVRMHGLNFRDVLNALGVFGIEHPRFGAECAGVVTRVGAAAGSFRPGDRVLAFAPFSLQSYTIVPEAFAAAVPSGMTFAQAATIPVAFLTAHYGFAQLARLSREQRVLIHAAAGGLGLAAVQLAQRVGAEIYATAGSERKREFLRRLGVRQVFDSRSTTFREDVLRATGGRGVDVVLNSLSGEMIRAGLETLAANGCFLEVGKRGLWTAEEVREFRPDIRYCVFDFGEVAKEDPETIRGMLRDLMAEFAAGRMQPLPTLLYPAGEAAAAFRTMAQAGHIGKIVLSRPAQGEAENLSAIIARGTVLVVGGLGALGGALAAWLAEKGARRLVLAGRSGSTDPALRSLLEAAGAEVAIEQMDVTNPEAVEGVLRRIRASGVPLTAVFHAAGIVQDRVLEGESWASYRQAAAGKIEGAWNLHRLTEADPVELMVFFSSAAGVLGSPGQGSYAAGNTFLDSLAHYRASRGLATLSVDWGAWATAGMAARLAPEYAARLQRQGMRSLEAAGALASLEKAVAERRTQVAVMDVAWDRFLEGRAAADGALFAELRPRETSGAERTAAASIRDAVLSAPSENRKALMAAHVRDCARRALSLAAGAAVRDDVPLQEIGLDSLMAIDMKNELAQSLHLPLSAGLLFNYPTVGELTGHLLGLLPAAVSLPAAADDGEPNGLRAMSEEEAERLLLEELERSGNEKIHV